MLTGQTDELILQKRRRRYVCPISFARLFHYKLNRKPLISFVEFHLIQTKKIFPSSSFLVMKLYSLIIELSFLANFPALHSFNCLIVEEITFSVGRQFIFRILVFFKENNRKPRIDLLGGVDELHHFLFSFFVWNNSV